MSEDGNSKPSIFSHTGFMSVIAATVTALAAVAVAYIQKSGGAEKPAEANVSAAQANSAAPTAAPVYITKMVGGKMVKVLVSGPRSTTAGGGTAGGGTAASGEPSGASGGSPSESQSGQSADTGESASAPSEHQTAPEAPPQSSEPDPQPAAEGGEENP